MERDDESCVSEITIGPDGRIYVFGMSRAVLDIVGSLEPDNPRLRILLEHLESLPTAADSSHAANSSSVKGAGAS